MSSTRWLIATVAAVVLVAVVAVVVTSMREPPALPESSPEAAVQRYLQAIADGDREAVEDSYTPQLRERCEAREPGHRPPFPDHRTSFDADLVDTHEIDDDTVDVRVRLTEYSGEPPFGGGGYDHTETFRVQRVDRTWGIAEAPWPYYLCVG